MKNKILLSTLLGSALLVGCTADDVLDVNKAAVKVNPDAPVFNVSFVSDDASMRGDMGGGSMVWDTANDKLSLYNGGGKDASTSSGWAWAKHDGSSDFLASGKIKNFDAIYAQTSSADGVQKLTTESVVSEGFAIMVYPADTTYNQDGLSPVLRISNEQDKNTKNSTPFISEVLTIGQYDKKAPANTAGYGREYDVALRRVAGQMRLQLKAENQETLKSAGVDDIQYRKVTVTVTKAATTAGDEDGVVTNPFTTETVVRIGQQRYTEGATGIPTDGDGVVGLNPKDGSLNHWSYTPWLEPVDVVTTGTTVDKANNTIKASNKISTTDITIRNGEKEAIYTLLPYDDRKDYSTAVYNEDGTPKYDKVVIDVETYYGNIQVVELESAKVWADTKGNELTLVDGLSTLMKEMFAPYTNEADKVNYPRYRNQLLPVNKLGIITVDWSKLNFDKLHITSSDQLRDVLKVYNALYPDAVNGEPATLILDGDSKGVFTMNEDAWAAVDAQLKKEGNKVKFMPCNNHGNTKAPTGCVTVRLNEGTTTKDIPELAFEENSQSTNGIDLELVGAWKYNGKNAKTNNTAHNYLAIDGVKEIHVTNNATLTVSGAVTASKDGSAASEVKLVIDNGGTMTTADGIVYVDQDVENKGTINIPANTELRMTSSATLTNRETQDDTKDKNKNYTATGLTTAKIGVINVTGKLNVGATQNTTPKIVNLGEIYQKTDNAYVLVTSNSDLQSTNGVEKAFERKDFGGSNNHIYGSIYLSSVNGCGNVSILGLGDHTDNAAGFIKLEVSKNKAKKADYGNANYIIFTGDSIWSETNTTTGVEYLPTDIKYIEVKSTKNVRFGGSTQYRLRALVVPEGQEMTVEFGSNVYIANAAYAKGQIYGSGVLMMQKNKATFASYFGGSETDETEHVGTANGVQWVTSSASRQ